MELEYTEAHREHFEDVCQELGREPTWEELDKFYRSRIECMVEFYKDFLKLSADVKILKNIIYSMK